MMKKIFLVSLLTLLFFTSANAALLNQTKLDEIDTKTADAAQRGNYGTLVAGDLNDILIIIVQAILSVLGMIFLILIFIAGNSWMQAAGNQEKVEKAKDTIRNLLIGLALIVIAYALSAGFGGLLTSVILK